jgi:diguanylate cyclase
MSNSPPDKLTVALNNSRALRLRQVLMASILGISATALAYLALSQNIAVLSVLFAMLAGLLYALKLARQMRIELAASIMLWVLTLGVTLLVASNNGLVDEGMFGYPVILIFAALFSKPRLFWALFGFICFAVMAIGLTQLAGWNQVVTVTVDKAVLINVMVILLLTGFSVRFQASDIRNALDNLAEENKKFRVSEAKATYLAQYDSLTSLPNRTLCEDRFNQQLEHIKRYGGQCALLFVDLDNFKTINDSLGHSVGDQVLQSIAHLLERCLRATDTACRFGGDEFIVLLTEITEAKEVERVATKILKFLARPLKLESHYIQTSASIGIALAPRDGSDFESYCKNADIAMYRAKADGKNLFRFFDTTMNTLSDERFVLIKDLRKAVKNNELCLFYQPKVDLRTGLMVGAEALLRWQHPERGLMAPGEFIELAEETGLIVEIGNWVLKEACRQCKCWHQAGHGDLEIAVNLSPVQFSRGTLSKEVLKALALADLAGRHLELELTESLLLGDAENIRLQLQELRAHGVSFSIDDFGTGYSNLGYLSKFDLESLKIDQSFVRKMLDSKQDLNIIIAIINIAKSLGLFTVAEGIEDPLALERLTALGCDLGQGYYWSRPLPPQDFAVLLHANRPTASANQNNLS